MTATDLKSMVCCHPLMDEDTAGTPSIGKRYRLMPFAERSSFSEGRVAFDTLQKRNVVLVELPAGHDSSLGPRPLEAADRIDQLTDLDHPSLIKVFDYYVEDGRTFLVIEPIDARSFSDLFSRERTPALSNILQWSDDLFDALIYLHSRPEPFIHSDVTPSTVWLTLSSNLKLSFPAPRRSAMTDLALGAEGRPSSLQYRSLEYLWDDIDQTTKMVISRGFDDAPFDELLGSKPDERSDIYSLSATLYFAMTRTAPTDAMTRTVNILDGAVDPVHTVSELNHNISGSLSNVIMRGLSIKRAERYHSAYEMRTDLASVTAPLFDSLTRLPNEIQFGTHLLSTIESSEIGDRSKFAVMLIELDEIETIFERFGPLLGNEAIYKLSERIRSSVRINDVVGRIGPHTFALILYEAGSSSDILRIAARIQVRLFEALNIEGTSVQMTSSVGTSVSGTIEKPAESYLEEARAAAQTARVSGPNSSAIF
jgi:diguanylate cyclase (GGDEF)-like protein